MLIIQIYLELPLYSKELYIRYPKGWSNLERLCVNYLGSYIDKMNPLLVVKWKINVRFASHFLHPNIFALLELEYI